MPLNLLSREESESCLAGRQGGKSSLTRAAVVVVQVITIDACGAFDALVVFANVAVVAAAATRDGSSVAEVVVDTDQVRGHAAGANILERNVARAIRPVVRAVAAAAVELSRVGDGVVADCDAPGAIGLDDLVVCASGTATFDEDIACSKSSNSVYASQLNVFSFQKTAAPSQTFLNQTFLIVHLPRQ